MTEDERIERVAIAMYRKSQELDGPLSSNRDWESLLFFDKQRVRALALEAIAEYEQVIRDEDEELSIAFRRSYAGNGKDN